MTHQTHDAHDSQRAPICADCHQPIPQGKTRQCEACDATLCAGCARWWADRAYCEEHRLVCASCGRDDDADGTWCQTCEDPVCSDCVGWCHDCDETLCAEHQHGCGSCGESYCGYHYDEHECSYGRRRHPDYRSPYAGRAQAAAAFTFGLEIEINGPHERDRMQDSPLVAGWCPDGSLDDRGLEYQTQPLTHDRETVGELSALVAAIPADPEDRAGGHLHVRRTGRQTPAGWYWALHALDDEQAASLNMRHRTYDRWCALRHGDYHGKETAVNGDHTLTIELRTFGAWHAGSAMKLAPALDWAHTMWRFLQRFPAGGLKARDIERMSRVACRQAQPAAARKRRIPAGAVA
jgi:hypothetical protein